MEIMGLLNNIYPQFMMFMLIFMRVMTFFMTFSMFRREMATLRVLISLSMILSLYVLILTKPAPLLNELFSLSYFMHTIVQFILGFTSGLIMNIMLDIFSAIGQVISIQIGLSASSLFDPKFGVITSLTHFYVMLGSILFLKMDGHLILVAMLVKSFYALPVTLYINEFHGLEIAKFSEIIFSGSVAIAITIIAAILMTNLAMAFISKFAPQFNLFSIGLNLSILIGLFCLFLSFQIYIDHGNTLIQSVLSFFQHYIMELSHHG